MSAFFMASMLGSACVGALLTLALAWETTGTHYDWGRTITCFVRMGSREMAGREMVGPDDEVSPANWIDPRFCKPETLRWEWMTHGGVSWRYFEHPSITDAVMTWRSQWNFEPASMQTAAAVYNSAAAQRAEDLAMCKRGAIDWSTVQRSASGFRMLTCPEAFHHDR